MILQSRKWRLLIRTSVLVLAGLLMLIFAAPASYALQDDTPKPLRDLTQLHDDTQPIADTYVYTSAVPDVARGTTTKSLVTTYHWIPIPNYGNQLLVRTEGEEYLHAYYRAADLNMDEAPRAANFYGKVTTLKSQADADKVVEDLEAQGVYVDKETAMVIMQGEEPGTYRPMVPVVGVLATSWVVALIGLLRILRGHERRRMRYSTR